MTTPTHRAVLYLLAYLRDAGERGWREAVEDPDHDPALGSVVLDTATGERMAWRFRFNGGDSRWFCEDAPERLWTGDAMPVPFRDGAT